MLENKIKMKIGNVSQTIVPVPDFYMNEGAKQLETFINNALGKTYRYTCYSSPIKPVFDRKYVYVLVCEIVTVVTKLLVESLLL